VPIFFACGPPACVTFGVDKRHPRTIGDFARLPKDHIFYSSDGWGARGLTRPSRNGTTGRHRFRESHRWAQDGASWTAKSASHGDHL